MQYYNCKTMESWKQTIQKKKKNWKVGNKMSAHSIDQYEYSIMVEICVNLSLHASHSTT